MWDFHTTFPMPDDDGLHTAGRHGVMDLIEPGMADVEWLAAQHQGYAEDYFGALNGLEAMRDVRRAIRAGSPWTWPACGSGIAPTSARTRHMRSSATSRARQSTPNNSPHPWRQTAKAACSDAMRFQRMGRYPFTDTPRKRGAVLRKQRAER